MAGPELRREPLDRLAHDEKLVEDCGSGLTVGFDSVLVSTGDIALNALPGIDDVEQ